MITRKIAMTAGAAAAAALVATGVTYASAPEVPSASASTPAVNQAAPSGGDNGQAKGNGAAPGTGAGGAVAGNGGDNGGRGGDNGGRDNGGRGGDEGGRGGDNGGRGGDDFGGGGRDGGGRGDDDFGGGGGRDGGGRGGRGYEGRIDFNERSYSAQSWGCITVVSGLGSRSFNVRNDSRRTVEVFRGATCDNGSPVATVGPWSTSNGVVSHFVHGGVKVKDGVVGSFRVVRDRHGW